MRLDATASRRALAAGLVLLVADLALLALLGFPPPAAASPFDPPTAKQAQRIIANAYDAKLRARYPRSGITTRCRGRRHLLCSVHVYRRGQHLFWTITRVDLESGATRTSLSPVLRGCISIAGKPLTYRSRPLDA